MLLWCGLARASDPSQDGHTSEEVVVTAGRLAQAEADLVDALHDRGYFRLARLGERTYWFTSHPWKPWVMVHDQGFARYHSVRLYPVGPSPSVGLDGAPLPGGGATFVTQSTRQLRAQRGRLADAIEPYLANVREAEWAQARANKLAALQDELVRTWFDPASPAEARRRWLVERWLHTEPDEDGRQVRDRVTAFVDAHVQPSATPFTAEEIAAANAARAFDDRFEPAARGR